MAKRRLSGIQPSGQLHLGNYLGAIRQHIAMQDDAYYFIANYHAQTTVFDPQRLRAQTRDAAATYLALGLDPGRATLFTQASVPEVTELMWLLAVVSSKGLLDRAVSYKDKVAQGITAGLGLYIYPVLMAADILAYETDVVPIGSDQVQHVEICRDIAQSFNSRYGGVFQLPDYEIGTPTPVSGTDGRKMSKSYDNTIPIFSHGAALRERVMRIVTDPAPLEARKDPSTCTVFRLYAHLSSLSAAEEMADRYRAGGYGYGHAKQALIACIEETFAPARARHEELMARPDDLDDILAAGAHRARATARRVLERARSASGL